MFTCVLYRVSKRVLLPVLLLVAAKAGLGLRFAAGTCVLLAELAGLYANNRTFFRVMVL